MEDVLNAPAPMNPRPILSFVIFVFIFGTLSQAQESRKTAPLFSTDLAGGDLQFLTSVGEQGMLLANMSELAANRAQSAEVKKLGHAVAGQYASQNEQVKLVAIKKGITIPSAPNSFQKAQLDKLAATEGLKFDKAYMEEMTRQQQSYLALFEQTGRTTDPDIKSLVEKLMPVVKQQLSLFRSMTGTAPRGAATPRFRINIGNPTDTAPSAN